MFAQVSFIMCTSCEQVFISRWLKCEKLHDCDLQTFVSVRLHFSKRVLWSDTCRPEELSFDIYNI